MSQEMPDLVTMLSKEFNVKASGVQAAIRLLDDGATVPFIARYRKEATGGLDDQILRKLTERLYYIRDLNSRRAVVLTSIREQDKLTPELEQAILNADSKIRLEDLYLPYRPKRRTKASIAIESGLQPLAMDLWKKPELVPIEHAHSFIDSTKSVPDAVSALEGARHILIEYFSEHPDLVKELREYMWQHAVLTSADALSKQAKEPLKHKFRDYMAYQEPIKKIPSHRAMALFRGRREQILKLSLVLNDPMYPQVRMADYFHIQSQQRPADEWLLETIRLAWQARLANKLELELFARLREIADEEAIRVFSENLRDLLLSPPAGHEITIGLDPGIRTGVKVAVVDATGKLLDYTTIFPFAPQNEWHESITALAKLSAKHCVHLVSIGNGTASRETERLVQDMFKMYPDLSLKKVLVNEAGASVYSASELAAKEFPDLDVSIRGAVSIARRLQDPLAELVKIEPKSIGVGQYQHDVNQARLSRSLEGVVEDCVNAVGVNVNTASAELLSRVSGLNESIALNLVTYRNEHGPFKNREELKNVPRMGDKTYQQAAGFLRIIGKDNPLDATGVHPEAYLVVHKILTDKAIELTQLLRNKELISQLDASRYIDEQFGLPTVQDILHELEKPGRDPRRQFKAAVFQDGILDLAQLVPGMVLQGIVSNVTNFGAFVDVGVHQDGLVHISEMTHQFISDPRSIVKAGDVVTVRVIEVDKERRRIGLSMKMETGSKSVEKVEHHEERRAQKNDQKAPSLRAKSQPHKKPTSLRTNKHSSQTTIQKPILNTAMADALSRLKRGSHESDSTR